MLKTRLNHPFRMQVETLPTDWLTGCVLSRQAVDVNKVSSGKPINLLQTFANISSWIKKRNLCHIYMSEADVLTTGPSLRKLLCAHTYQYAPRRSSGLVRRSLNLNPLETQPNEETWHKKIGANKLIIFLPVSLLLWTLSEASLSPHSSATFSRYWDECVFHFLLGETKLLCSSSLLCCTFIYLFIMD